MYRLRDCFLVVIALTQLCSLAKSAMGKPQAEIGSILKLFPGYHVMTLTERDTDTRTFLSQHYRESNSSVVRADFNGDGILDYALMLKYGKSPTAKFVVLFCSGDSTCRKVYELDVTGYSDSVYLKPVPVGSRASQTDAIDTKDSPAPVKLRSTGIEVTYFGKAKVVYYWNKKHRKIEAVQTED